MFGILQVFKYLTILILSILLGGGSYLGAVTFIKATTENSQSKIPDNSLTGEMELFAVTEKPIDLGFDERGFLYILNQSGTIMKCIDQDSQAQQMSKFYEMGGGNFLPNQGCSTFALHPDYLIKHTPGYGKIYISASEVAGSGNVFETIETEHHQEVIYELTNLDPNSEVFSGEKREVMRISAERADHNVFTDLTFDNVGHLYVGISDTSAQSRAIDLGSIYGKVLRVDPTKNIKKGLAYSIPERNPFYYVTSSLKEIWAYGLRQPHAIYFDPFNRSICISDTGVEGFEEINFSTTGAEFFGWNIAEGSFFVPTVTRQNVSEGIIKPQIEYSRNDEIGRNVGGFIYRGEQFPHLDGKSIFADETGQLLLSDTSAITKANEISILLESPVSGSFKVNGLKQGPSGELFLLCDSGEIYELKKYNPYKKFQRGSMMASVMW